MEERIGGILRAYEDFQPDIIGFREVAKSWYGSGMFERLSSDCRFLETDMLDSEKCFNLPF